MLKLIAPSLNDITDLEGTVSLSLESVRLPLDRNEKSALDQLQLAGRLQLHDMKATTESPLISSMVKILNDLYSKQATEKVRIAKNADVHFKFANGRVYHEGLEIGFPDISPDLIGKSNGSIGIDGTLELELELPQLDLEQGMGNQSKKPPLHFRIRGTIDEPDVQPVDKIAKHPGNEGN